MTPARAVSLVVVLGGFLLRAWDLGGPSFWWDEAYSAVVARGSVADILATISREDFHPPLHYLILHVWRLAAGEGEYALRFVSLAAGTATIALAHATGRRLYRDRGAVLAAMIVALAPFHVYYSTEARMFALAGMFALLSLYLAHRAASIGSPSAWALVGVSIAVSLWNYYYALFIVIPIGLLALERRRSLIGFVGASLLAAILYLPWLPVLLARTTAWESPWTPPTTPGRVLLWTWPALTAGVPDLALWGSPTARVALLALAGLAALLALAIQVGPPAPSFKGGVRYAVAAAAGPLIAMALVALVRPIFHPRYAMPAAPGLYLALAGALTAPWRPLAPLRLALGAAIAFTFAIGLARLVDGEGRVRDDYRTAVGMINAESRERDAIITNAPPGVSYYARPELPVSELPGADYEPAVLAAQLQRAAQGRDRLWYVTHDLRPSDPEGFVTALLERRATRLDRRRYGQLEVALYALPANLAFTLPPAHDLGRPLVGDGLRLLEWAVDKTPHPAGETVPLFLTWEVRQPIGADLGVWAQLTDSEGFRWGRSDRQPRDQRFHLTGRWVAGSRVTTGHAIPIPLGTPPGEYRVEVGVYRLSDLVGLPIADATGRPIGQSIQLGTATVGRGEPSRARDPSLTGPTGTVDAAVELVGSGVSTREVDAGGTVEATLLWRALAPVGRRETVLQLRAPDGSVAAALRTVPGGAAFAPETWAVGELVRNQLRLVIPPTAPAGRYTLTADLLSPGASRAGIEIGSIDVRGIQRRVEAPPMDRAIEQSWADGVVLAGVRVEPTADGRRVVLIWNPRATPSRSYKVFVHALGDDGAILAQHDSVPANWQRPTTGWVRGEYVEDAHPLLLPGEARPMRLRVGLYDETSGQRLERPGGEDHLDLLG